MFIRRLLALLCSLFLVFCVAWPGAYAVEVPDLEDMGIDPWGDLGLIQETPEPAPTAQISEPAQLDPVVIDDEGEGGASVFSIGGGKAYSIRTTSANLFTWGYNPKNGMYQSKGYITSSALSKKTITSGSELVVDSWGPITGEGRVWETGNNTWFQIYTSNNNVSSLSNDYITISGTVRFEARMYKKSTSSASWGSDPTITYPSSIQFTLNYEPIGQPVTGENGVYTFEQTIDVSSFKGTEILQTGFQISADIGASMLKSGYSSWRWYFVDKVDFSYNDGPKPPAEDVTHGLLGSIIQFLQNIVNGIGNIGKAISELPGKIVTALIDGLKSLFIPSEEDLSGIKDQYTQLLEERLGFVWQAGEMVISFGQSVLSAFETATDFQFEFPGVSFELPELGQVTLIEPQTVNVNNAFMDVMQPVLGTIVSFICVLAFINTAERMVIAVVSGVSYFHFLKGD